MSIPSTINNPGPVLGLIAITPNDSTDIAMARGFHCNVAGNVKVTTASGNEVTLTVTAGVPYPYAVKRIWSTGTTATGIFGLY